MSHHQKTFDAVLARLNAAQRRAVEHIEGPVLVIAGPGTGKTHILAARVGYILQETDTQPFNILCLTFTDAAVQAMRQRLLQFIGPEAHRVPIYTFHAFCNSVIQDNLYYFGRQQLEPVSELERVQIIRQLLDALPPGHPLRRGKADVYFYEKQLSVLFQLMKTEAWLPEDIHRAAAEYLQDLPNRPAYIYKRKTSTFNKGDLKTSLIAIEEQRMEVLAAATDLFPRYEAAMQRLARYDYADMINWVLEAFKKHPNLLRRYQEQYLYMLVDEYQDTNGTQHELLQMLCDYWDSPNIFIVGDDDQSIFEFQGARLQNITQFYGRYRQSLQVVLLNENYRSTQPILDASHSLIDYNQQRIARHLAELDIEKRLLAAGDAANMQSLQRPVLQVFPNPLHEVSGILQAIKEMHALGTPWQEMAVIYARHKQVVLLQNLFDQEGIPYQTKRKTNVLDQAAVQQLLQMLWYLQEETERPGKGEHRLYKILHYRCWGLSTTDLARMSLHRAAQPYDQRQPWRFWLLLPEEYPKGLQNAAAITRVAQCLEQGIAHLHDWGLPQLIRHLANSSGLLKLALDAPDRLWQAQVLHTFFDFVTDEAQRKPRLQLDQFLRTLQLMDDNGIALHLRKEIELENGVHLLTAHGAKGLEFDTVFMLDVTDYWAGKRGGNTAFYLPDTLTLTAQDAGDETWRRLFYVAMTRAKRQLFLTYAAQNEKGASNQACRFVDELLEEKSLEIEHVTLPQQELLQWQSTQLQAPVLPRLSVWEEAAVAQLLQGFRLSFSAWHRWLHCPLRFFYEVVLEVPQIQRPEAAYGEAVHGALQRLFNAMMAQPQPELRQFPPLEVLLRFFEEEMRQRESWFTAQEWKRFLEQGRVHLSALYATQHETWPKHCKTEQRIAFSEIDGIPLKGTIDRVDLISDYAVHLVDYKTGSHNDDKLKPIKENNPHGGQYWRQLHFYQLLYSGQRNEMKTAFSASVVYIDLDKKGDIAQHDMEFHSEGLYQVKALLADAWAKIQQQDFFTGCGKPECEWCQFVHQQQSPPSATLADIEADDDLA